VSFPYTYQLAMVSYSVYQALAVMDRVVFCFIDSMQLRCRRLALSPI